MPIGGYGDEEGDGTGKEGEDFFESLWGEGSKAFSVGKNLGISAGTNEGNAFANQALSFYNKALAPFFDEAQAGSESLFAESRALQKDALGRIGEGYNNARLNVAEQGRIGTQGVMDAQTRSLGASQQAAIGAGLSGSTAHTTANRGIASDAARNIGQLQAGIGQLMSGLDIGQASAEAGALNNISNNLQQQAGFNQNTLGMKLSGITGAPIEAPQDSGFGSILGGLLSAIPFFGSGGGGGAAAGGGGAAGFNWNSTDWANPF